MKYGRSLMLMALGAGTVLAYQRYNKPIMRKMEKMFNKTMRKAENELENMM